MEHSTWNRRDALIAGLSLASPPTWSAENNLQFSMPDGACDAHHHIYDPRFPYLPDARKQAPATVPDYHAFQRRMRTSRDVIVLPSAYGTNNDPLLFFQGEMGENTRSIAVIHSDVGDSN